MTQEQQPGQGQMTPLKGLARLAALIYHYCAQEAVETLGEEEGRALMGRAIRKMGEERGRRIRERVDAAGLEPNLDNLARFYDLPIGEAWEATFEKREDGQLETVTYCPLAEVWQELGRPDLDMTYCDIDMAIINGYNPDIDIERLKSLLTGDGCCVYEYRWGGEKRSK